ncbi:hypothetical protein B0H21DRAFT_886711 [Amylocystis lapponica]|nr:hypothetical protein B0H21DRAFT_886711 [Amylocystis lapponica]
MYPFVSQSEFTAFKRLLFEVREVQLGHVSSVQALQTDTNNSAQRLAVPAPAAAPPPAHHPNILPSTYGNTGMEACPPDVQDLFIRAAWAGLSPDARAELLAKIRNPHGLQPQNDWLAPSGSRAPQGNPYPSFGAAGQANRSM